MNMGRPKLSPRIGLALLAAILAILFWLATRQSTAMQWLEQPPVSRSRFEFLGRWAQPARMLWFRTRYWLFGAPPSLTIQTKVLTFDPSVLPPLTLGQPALSNQGGAQAWIVRRGPEWNTFTNTGSEVLSSPTMSLGSGMQGRIMMSERVMVGGTPEDVGVRLDVLPRLRGEAVDLGAFLMVTEARGRARESTGAVATAVSIYTNVALGAQVRLPPGAGLFLLSTQTNEQGRIIGALIFPNAGP
jgi:hypothetical protein